MPPTSIRVNAVAPGLIETGLHPPGRLERLAPMMPIPRAGTPEEVAEAVLFLLSDAASYTTGTNLRVVGRALTHWREPPCVWRTGTYDPGRRGELAA